MWPNGYFSGSDLSWRFHDPNEEFDELRKAVTPDVQAKLFSAHRMSGFWLATPTWLIATPLGRPVLPEVNAAYASCCASAGDVTIRTVAPSVQRDPIAASMVVRLIKQRRAITAGMHSI